MSSRPTLDFLLFYVSDLEESLVYFTQTLGLEHDPRQDAPSFRGFAHKEGSVGYGLALVSKDTSPEARQPGTVEAYFTTDELDAMHAELTRKGAQPTAIAHRPFGSIFSIPAPDGHLTTMLRPPSR